MNIIAVKIIELMKIKYYYYQDLVFSLFVTNSLMYQKEMNFLNCSLSSLMEKMRNLNKILRKQSNSHQQMKVHQNKNIKNQGIKQHQRMPMRSLMIYLHKLELLEQMLKYLILKNIQRKKEKKLENLLTSNFTDHILVEQNYKIQMTNQKRFTFRYHLLKSS